MSTHRHRPRVLIVGGGIGGLAAAIALEGVGLPVQLLERADDPSKAQVGSGLTIWSNAVSALATLGLFDAVSEMGSRLERFENRTSTDKRLASWQVGDFGRQSGWPSLNLSRQDLHTALSAALRPGVLSLGARCVGFKQDADRVTVSLADGRQVHGDVLIGADGLNSTVRAALLGTGAPRYAGYAIWRAILDEDRVALREHEFVQLWGRGRRFGYYPLGGGRAYWWATLNSPRRPAAAGPWKPILRDVFHRWPAPVGALIAATAETEITRFGVYDRDPVRIWGIGRVSLLGDAAHPMSFNVGQGACQAIEDAVILAAHLRQNLDDPVAALRAYEADRKPRTAMMMRLARRIGTVAAWEHRAACTVRNQLLKLVLSGPAARQAREMITPIV